ncbi:MAG: outer membrane beta-barrel protein [Dysgonomonas sp.]
MKKGILISLFVLFAINVFAQNKVTISGTVLSETDNEPVPRASIRVLTAKDSTYVQGEISNNNGQFSVSVNKGRYIIQISFLGYSDVYLNVNAVNPTNPIGKVLLKENTVLLNEAVVIGKAVEMIVREDTVEYNADSYKTLPSAMVEDLIKKMPGAEIDETGKITVNGKEVKKILLDGKEFFSDDPKVASKNLPASMVNKVQVYDKKSDMSQMTGFDDGDEETVINLTVKPGMKQGVFGNGFAGYGSNDRYEANGMVNYMRNSSQFSVLLGANNTNNAGFSDFASTMFSGNRPSRGLNFGGNNGVTTAANGGFNFALETSPKLKLGGNVRYGSSDNDVQRDNSTKYFNSNTDSIQYENKKELGQNKSDNLGASLRLEWRPDSATTVIFKPNFQYNKNENSQSSDFATTWNDVTDTVSFGRSSYYAKGSGTSVSGDLEISRQLNKKGRVLSVRLTGGVSNQNSDGNNWNKTNFLEADSIGITDQIFNQKNKGNNMGGYISYVEPIGNSNFLQLNYSLKRTYSESDKKTFTRLGESGAYDIQDSSATRFLENNFINQEIGLNFRAVRKKYNYTLGFSVQPSNSRTEETRLDTAIITKNNVVNFAPVAQFNYMWSKQRNLRIDYNGTVNQPSTTQLSSARDESNPMNIVYGNPDLKPSFENRLRIRYRDFNSAQASTLMVMGNFSYVNNDIVSITQRDITSGKRETTYTNVNGNWNGNARLIYNTPLNFNKKFSISTMTYGSYSETNGYVNEDENKLKSLSLSERAGVDYRSSLFDLGLKGNLSYSSSSNSLSGQENYRFYNYGGSANTAIYLPVNLTIESDITYSTNSGYSEGYKQDELMWNASISKQLLKAKNLTVRLKFYDILKQRSNISQTVTNYYLQQSITSGIESYFMFHLVYKFQAFKGGAKASDMEMPRGPRGEGPPPGGGGPGGPGGGPGI